MISPTTVWVRYGTEIVDDGWLVWRATERAPEGECLMVSARRRRVFRSAPEAEAAIGEQLLADRAAATRLGVELEFRRG